MSRTVKIRELESALTKKGFKREEGGKHTKYFLVVDGKKTKIFTVLSRSQDQISKDLTKRIMKQLKFENNNLFEEFIECPMDYEKYIGYLKNRNQI
ncbi:MAG: type II toxin-antitoxin system HicA family toxin [Archaeoglobales archaeon]|nr:type II toxin-antitoxin system HicA family toxin [Archaeoglobales archaeon]